MGVNPRLKLAVLVMGWVVRWAGAASQMGCLPAVRPAPPSTVSLRVYGAPADATVTIDDEALGTFDFVASRGVALPPGVHHVTVEAAGYFPWDCTVQAKPGSPLIRLAVKLIEVPN